MINKEIYYKNLIEKKEKILNNLKDIVLKNKLKEEIEILKEKC